ncbi:2-amino-4-hydroxy-6-hydroxymethyldihydropteridine diphosphokinase [Rhodoferax aquaticus]|uniref:2-amino-4-hydroxy-6-hydroxymethyldihydropteridine pyrophosphokinase n=1 Tax=Rhodoferax aquaticus TaxID=2527691 RepID=A0A515EMY0_9BURK|nr:2-amino-4-hydroxy-6-hydroxymethyldihydropteridine diphosphokinase [Rhodoferax aquaticus]QDL53984.1 2-amino-4-hydroxy-6-hydroxymethyldihydropteridine diphosphokinase [Rhodoferax aquaticus]
MRDWVTAYIGLGANLGNPAHALHSAVQALAANPGIAQCRASSLYSSAPIDSSGPDYTNAVLKLQTRLSAPDLLVCLQTIELQAGRLRPYRNAPRTLDLDLLLYGDGQVHSPSLVVPHPRMWERAFVLVPLAEVGAPCVDAHMLARVASQPIRRLPP